MILPLTNTQRVARFGRFAFEPDPQPANPEAIRILGDWPIKNIVKVPCLELGAVGRTSCLLHRAAAESFVKLWRAWDKAGLLAHVKTWNGSFVPRFKRGKAGGGVAALSNHSWGTAFDINARLYPLGFKVPELAPIRDLGRIANELGWFWGGNFRSRPDGQHFEFCG